MSERSLERPRLKVSFKEKIKNDNQYSKNWIDYIRGTSRFHQHYHTTEYDEFKVLYDLANGWLDEKWFHHVTNPFNAKRPENKKFPVRLQMYNLLFANFRQLMGEKINRPFNYQVVNKGPDSDTQRTEALKEQIRVNLEQRFINNVNEEVDTGVPSQPVEELDELKTTFNETYHDALATQGQDIMDYISQHNRLKEKFLNEFRDWLIVGEAYNYSYVQNEEVLTSRVSPFQIDYSRSGEEAYVEDADWVIRRQLMSPNQILDKFWDHIKDSQLEEVDKMSYTGNTSYYSVFHSFYNRDDRRHQRNEIEVLHCQWRTFKKVGVYSYFDEFGTLQEQEVPEDFKLSKQDKQIGNTLRFVWTNEVWEGYKIDNKIYLGIRPLPYQRSEINNKAESKLSYNGKKFANVHSNNTSIMRLGLPWQRLYIIMWYRLERLLANSKGKMAVLPIQALPTGEGKEGWDMENFLYSSTALNMMLVDLEGEGMKGQGVNNILGSVDLSQAQDAQFIIQQLEYIKQQWDDIIGYSPARKGQQSASQGLGVTQYELAQSNAATELIFTEFEQLEERIMQQLLDHSKFAFINGKKSGFVRSDESIAYLNVDPLKHLNADLGIFVKKSASEVRNLERLKEAGIAAASQGQRLSTIAEIIEGNNYSKIKKILREVEDKELAQLEQQQQAVAQGEQQTLQMQAQLEQQKLEVEEQFKAYDRSFEEYMQDKKYQHEKELAVINKSGEDSNENLVNDADEAANTLETLKFNAEQQLKQQELVTNATLKREEIAQKERDSQRKLQIAKTNKNKHDA